MIITPQIYARALVEALEEQKDAKKIATSFWKYLIKNKQNRKLPLILSALDEEYAKNQGKKLIRVFYGRNLSEENKNEIHKKLVCRFGKDILMVYVKRPDVTGIIARGDDKEINLSLEGKIIRLKQAFNQVKS
jgi:F0F1-type ATP synthase delta subunit